jgi:hypothetical protein
VPSGKPWLGKACNVCIFHECVNGLTILFKLRFGICCEVKDLKINRKVHKHDLFWYGTQLLFFVNNRVQLTCRKNLFLRIQSMSSMIVGFYYLSVCPMRIVNFCFVICFRLRKSKDGKMPKLPKARKEAVKIGVPEIYKSTEESEPFLRYVAIV